MGVAHGEVVGESTQPTWCGFDRPQTCPICCCRPQRAPACRLLLRALPMAVCARAAASVTGRQLTARAAASSRLVSSPPPPAPPPLQPRLRPCGAMGAGSQRSVGPVSLTAAAAEGRNTASSSGSQHPVLLLDIMDTVRLPLGGGVCRSAWSQAGCLLKQATAALPECPVLTTPPPLPHPHHQPPPMCVGRWSTTPSSTTCRASSAAPSRSCWPPSTPPPGCRCGGAGG